jgi:hypothetical protein
MAIDPSTINFVAQVQSHAEQDQESPTAAAERKKAEREAKGRHRKARRGAIKLKLNCVGDPGVTAKTVIEIKGLGERLSGNYYVENVKHSLGDGYKMTMLVRRDGSNRGRRRAKKPERTRAPVNKAKAPTPEAGEATPALKPRYVIEIDQPSQQALAWARKEAAAHADEWNVVIVESGDVELVED